MPRDGARPGTDSFRPLPAVFTFRPLPLCGFGATRRNGFRKPPAAAPRTGFSHNFLFFIFYEWQKNEPFLPLRSTPPQGFPCPDLFRTQSLSRLRAAPLPFPMSALLLPAAFLPYPMSVLLLPAAFLPFPMAPLLLPVAFLPFPVTPLPEPTVHLRPNPGPDPKPGQHPDPGPGPAPKPGRAPVPKPRRLPGPGLRADPIPNSSPRNRRPKRLCRFPSRLQLCLPPLPRLPLRRP